MSSSQRPARQRNILDYSKLDNVGREEALIRRATRPNSSPNIDSNIDPALSISQNSIISSAINLPTIPTYLEQDYLLVNDYTTSSNSDIDDES
jgi:hypothetical protein